MKLAERAAHFEMVSRRQFTEIASLKKENAELRALFDRASKWVLPGECDTPDALSKLLVKIQAENKLLRVALERAKELFGELNPSGAADRAYDEIQRLERGDK